MAPGGKSDPTAPCESAIAAVDEVGAFGRPMPPYSQCCGGGSLRFAIICGKSATVRMPGGASQT